LRNKEKKIQLAKYRLKQAEDSISEAECLLSGNESPRSIMNRAYYAMFYGVLALIVFEQYYSSKHASVLSYFNKRFIKEGVFSKELGYSINKAFEMRQEGDYRREMPSNKMNFLKWLDFLERVFVNKKTSIKITIQ